PLNIQFCANDLLTFTEAIQEYHDAVDLNLGCPQDNVRSAHYGSFLQDEWELIHNTIPLIISLCIHTTVNAPHDGQIPSFSSTEKTIVYAQMLENTCAQTLMCHSRICQQRGHNTSLAD
ncbi:hypothetical protein F5J12DRAFT_727458, partial [Pisolithus orientalis]|uniref:uncharacterized protein n=1 Tax=Pisolithus orientalis TaxID=936130 RepID=UPI0022251732